MGLVPLAQRRHGFLRGLHQPRPQVLIFSCQPFVFLQGDSQSILRKGVGRVGGCYNTTDLIRLLQ